MRTGTYIGILLMGASAVASAQAPQRTYLVGLNAVQGGSCASFGGGWQDFAFDGSSGIRFCKKLSTSRPPPGMGIIDISGIFPGNSVGCAAKLGAEWSDWAFDGHANIRFCMRMGDVDSAPSYIADVNAIVGSADVCETSFAGHGWDRVVYNGKSNITFCAQFR